MANKPLVSVKTKTAACFLIGMGALIGVPFSIYFMKAIVDLIAFGPLNEAAMMIAVITFTEAVIIALAVLVAGLLLFERKRRAFLLALIILLAAYMVLFALWRGSVTPYDWLINHAGCDLGKCEVNISQTDSYYGSLDVLMAATGFPVYWILLIVSLVFSGIKILELNKRWWIFSVALMVFDFMTHGMFGCDIGSFGQNSLFSMVSTAVLMAVSLFVISLLLSDAKQFFGRKTAE